jgi:hypothetical protein
MKISETLILAGFFTIFTGCGQIHKPDLQEKFKLEEITSKTDMSKGFSDIFMKIILDNKTDSTHIYLAKGLYKNKTTGLQFEVNSNIPHGITFGGNFDRGIKAAINGVRIKSKGEESDNFIKALAELYSFPTNKPFSKKTISASAFLYKQRIADLDKKDVYKFDLIFEDNNEELFSELVFIINTSEGIIELNEKDVAYRQRLINIFTEQ